MEIFRITFMQYHPLKDGFVAIEAKDYEGAHAAAMSLFGGKFAFCYAPKDFDGKFFPAGQFGRTVNAEDVTR